MARLGQLLCKRLDWNNTLLSKGACTYSCRRNKSNSHVEPPKQEHPIDRSLRILGNDFKTVKSFFTSDETPVPRKYLPGHCDIVVIGGGVIGSSIAYWLQQRAPAGLNIIVVEKDPSVMPNIFSPVKYCTASTVLSVGGLRQQFSLEENIQISMFGAEFLRNIKEYLSVEGQDPPCVQFTPNGYLFLATESGAEQLEKNARVQAKLGVKNELLVAAKLKEKFPWLNTDGIALGCCGHQNEG